MPIETICQGCGRKLRVPDEHAGRKARCPACRRVYTVPGPAESSPLTDDQTQPWRPRHDSVSWRLRVPDGRIYGPVPKAELDEWLDEGRISAECQLQSDASPEWLPATQIYPQLLSPAATFTSSPSAGSRPTHSTSQQPNPYESFSHVSSRRYLRPHRSGQILTLGLLGFCCGFLGIFAWVMGHSDLREMQAGRMDPSGRGTTRAGYILGIITTVLWAARLLGNVLERAF